MKMKKLLNVSAIATLAVLPLSANATDIPNNAVAVSAADDTKAATAGYVKGAYLDLAGYINTKADKTTVQALSEAVEALNGAEGSIAGQIKADAEDADFTSDVYEGTETPVLEATTIGGAINELSAIKADADTAATKVGVTNTIANTTVTGTVPALMTWGSDTPTTVAISTTVNAAQYSEPE